MVITHRYKKQLAQHTIQWKKRVVKVANKLLIVRNAYTYKSNDSSIITILSAVILT